MAAGLRIDVVVETTAAPAAVWRLLADAAARLVKAAGAQ
jgi:hypothetical protein